MQTNQSMIAAGHLGRKSGQGFYRYPEGAPALAAASIEPLPAGTAVEPGAAFGHDGVVVGGVHVIPTDGRTAQQWARELGFADCRIASLDTGRAAQALRAWLDAGRHGQMDYMERHFALRADAHALLPEARAAVLVRMDYLNAALDADWREQSWQAVRTPERAVVSRYALGRDYHKVLRHRLQRLAERIDAAAPGGHQYRVFTDSAPVLEVELASRSSRNPWQLLCTPTL